MKSNVLATALVAAAIFFTNGCSNATSSLQPTPQSESESRLRVASWNIEHLAYPANTGCKPRNAREIKALRRYAEGLEADIVALQEVHSVAALEQVFDTTKWQFILSDRQDSPAYECRGSNHTSTQQKTAFAIRKGLEIKAHQDLATLGLQRVGLRHGLVVNVATPLGDISLLNVHLKSGCFVADYAQSDKLACELIGAQLPKLKTWLQQRQNQPAIVLGDFNHRLAASDNRFRSELSEGIQSYNVTASMKGCHPRYPAPIDHILFSEPLYAAVQYEPKVHFFKQMQEEQMLSDHCAISVTVKAK
ncbi:MULTISPECIES: endonuclease/exonuclease/phosphatase family protein [unclassified Pseudoalteromonas]|uniref:endonuclease/exonuclease/phosphatase family protein n=1 Tax=unclassified Pseudoalteromonas TaxID=194690 RepID=UPI0030144F96